MEGTEAIITATRAIHSKRATVFIVPAFFQFSYKQSGAWF
jgi:hypothetical protein